MTTRKLEIESHQLCRQSARVVGCILDRLRPVPGFLPRTDGLKATMPPRSYKSSAFRTLGQLSPVTVTICITGIPLRCNRTACLRKAHSCSSV